MSRRWWMVVAAIGIAVAAALAWRHFGWPLFRHAEPLLAVDLSRPDALVRTASLSRLPRDLLRIPVARDVLAEDFVFYYAQHEDRLGLDGALRRIAYERELAWTDRLIARALDEPAEVALWRDGKGALRHFAIVLRRNAIAMALQEAATAALKDRQLSRAAEIRVGGTDVPVYALALHPRRTLLVAAKGERVVVLSDPGLLLGADSAVGSAAQAAVAKWLADDDALGAPFALGERGRAGGGEAVAHTLVVRARALTLGYAPFVPGLVALRFDFGAQGWSTDVLLDPARLPAGGLGDAELWRAAPANPAACVLLPLDMQAVAKVATGVDPRPAGLDAKAFAGVRGDALACWYRESSLYSPLFVARLSAQAPDREALAALAQWAIRPSLASAVADGDLAEAEVPPLPPMPRRERPATAAASVWRAAEPSGDHLPERLAEVLSTPALAVVDGYALFSPDARLVDLGLDTIGRRHPSVSDQGAGGERTLAVLTPRSLAAMAEREALGALSRPGEEKLRQAAQTLLVPRTRALAGYPPYLLVLPSAPRAGWQRVEWRTAEAPR